MEINRNNKNVNLHNVVGLENRSLDCFMNSSLQCLFCVPELMDFFINKKYLENLLQSCKSIIGERKSNKAMKLSGYRYCDALYYICSKVVSNDSS